jgi:signal transduction histidine kinase
MSGETIPTLTSLAQARARQQATVRILRPLAVGVVVLVVVGGSRTHPRPALSGEGLAILAALVAFVVGMAGVMRSRHRGASAQAPFFVVLVVAASTLVWLQPHGPGFVAVFVAVGAAAMQVGERAAAVIVVVALAAIAAAEIASGTRSTTSILLSELGVIAFYAIARLARRLREGQEQAERLLIELDESRDAQARGAALAERQRLAREMHDVLAHSLSGLVLQLEGARLLAARSDVPEAIETSLSRAHHLAKSGLEEARRAIAMLRDDDLPGPERLTALTRELEADLGVPCEATITGVERDLGSEAGLTVYRVAQEALTNVRKHAHPRRVELRLAYEPEGARLTVEDFAADGRPPDAASNGGYGLTGMRERADLLGASLTAAPTDAGFRVELWVPA